MGTKLATAVIAATLLLCGTAAAGNISIVYGTDESGCGAPPLYTTFTAGPNEINRLALGSVKQDPAADLEGVLNPFNPCGDPTLFHVYALLINDGSSDITSIPPSCGRLRPRIVVCQPMTFVAILGDRDDQLVLSAVDHQVTVYAGPGNDQIRTLNSGQDSVTCGIGVDTVYADVIDVVAADCESVTRL